MADDVERAPRGAALEQAPLLPKTRVSRATGTSFSFAPARPARQSRRKPLRRQVVHRNRIFDAEDDLQALLAGPGFGLGDGAAAAYARVLWEGGVRSTRHLAQLDDDTFAAYVPSEDEVPGISQALHVDVLHFIKFEAMKNLGWPQWHRRMVVPFHAMVEQCDAKDSLIAQYNATSLVATLLATLSLTALGLAGGAAPTIEANIGNAGFFAFGFVWSVTALLSLFTVMSATSLIYSLSMRRARPDSGGGSELAADWFRRNASWLILPGALMYTTLFLAIPGVVLTFWALFPMRGPGETEGWHSGYLACGVATAVIGGGGMVLLLLGHWQWADSHFAYHTPRPWWVPDVLPAAVQGAGAHRGAA